MMLRSRKNWLGEVMITHVQVTKVTSIKIMEILKYFIM
jgi:hypothetical protein